MNPTIQAAKNMVSIQVDEKVFPRDVVVAAAYIFIDRCYIRLERALRGRVLARIKGKKKLSRNQLVNLADEFENELLHQLIRRQVAERTDGLREVIVGRALFSAEPESGAEAAQAEPQEDMDYLDDPLGIAIPWEEKYGDDKKEEEGQ
jgi:His-Xaa-Ser system protein HxsD